MEKERFRVTFTYDAEVVLSKEEAEFLKKKTGMYWPEKKEEEPEWEKARENTRKELDKLKEVIDNVFLMGDGRTEASVIRDASFVFKDIK